MKILVNLLMLFALSSTVRAEDNLILAKLSLHEATQKVLSEGNYRVLGASSEFIDGREVHIIKVLTPDGRILHFKVDAESGVLIK